MAPFDSVIRLIALDYLQRSDEIKAHRPHLAMTRSTVYVIDVISGAGSVTIRPATRLQSEGLARSWTNHGGWQDRPRLTSRAAGILQPRSLDVAAEFPVLLGVLDQLDRAPAVRHPKLSQHRCDVPAHGHLGDAQVVRNLHGCLVFSQSL